MEHVASPGKQEGGGNGPILHLVACGPGPPGVGSLVQFALGLVKAPMRCCACSVPSLSPHLCLGSLGTVQLSQGQQGLQEAEAAWTAAHGLSKTTQGVLASRTAKTPGGGDSLSPQEPAQQQCPAAVPSGSQPSTAPEGLDATGGPDRRGQAGPRRKGTVCPGPSLAGTSGQRGKGASCRGLGQGQAALPHGTPLLL